MRNINEEGLALIKRWEGLRLEAYRDVAGVWTIGYGHTATARAEMVITEAQAESLLLDDLARFEQAVERLITVALTENQFAALVSFAFNVGEGALERSTLRKKLNAGDYAAVPAELAKWNKARVGGKLQVVDGLANRRAAEAGLWARGSFVTSRDTVPAPEPVKLDKDLITAGGSTVAVVVTALAGNTTLALVIGIPAAILILAIGGAYAWRKWREAR